MTLPVLPGVYIERVDNITPVQLIFPTEAYMIGLPGTGATVSPLSAPTRVTSVAEFIASFGTGSASLIDVQAYFNNTTSPLWFISVNATLNADAQHLNYGAAMDLIADNVSGILVMPRAFMADSDDIDLTALVSKAKQTQERTGLYVIIDVPSGATVSEAIDFVDSVKPISDASVYYPYITVSGELIPPSAAMAGLTLTTIRNRGVSQVPAGIAFPLRGATVANISNVDLESLYLADINAIRTIRGGTVVMGARTLSNRLFINTALILSSIRQTLTSESTGLLFTPIDNQGQMFMLAQGLINRILFSYFNAGALIGLTPREAYTVICDNTNNSRENLLDGVLYATIILSPSSSVEKVIITPRINIGA
jgi:hypothetical protein